MVDGDGVCVLDEGDAEIVALARDGDGRRALELLMQRYDAAILRFCRRSLRDHALAEDVRQRVFLQAHRDLPHFGGRSSLRSWLLAIAHHRVVDQVRSGIRHTRDMADLALRAPAPAPAPSAHDLLDANRRDLRIATAVQALPARMRSAVLMRYQHGLSFSEMESLCGEKANTLQIRVTRALDKLRVRLAHEA